MERTLCFVLLICDHTVFISSFLSHLSFLIHTEKPLLHIGILMTDLNVSLKKKLLEKIENFSFVKKVTGSGKIAQ